MVALLCTSCEGLLVAPTGAAASAAVPPGLNVSTTGVRRLTRTELDATLKDLFSNAPSTALALLPPDPTDPFDNNYRSQLASAALIEAFEQLATDVSEQALVSPSLRATLLGCQPTGPSDAACFKSFIAAFGLRAFRRPLASDEIDRFATLQSFAIEAQDFDVGARLVIRAFLQEPEFLYRVELGSPTRTPGVFKLSPYEVASRLSFFLWGTTPPEWLLQAAASGQLADAKGVREASTRLLADARARERVERFHALWLGYHRLPHDAALTQALQAESAALVDRVVFEEDRDYFDLFALDETYIDQSLANHYALTTFTGTPGARAWTKYGTAKRKGLLGHGAVLSQGVRFADSSPTQRGIFIRNRLLCQEIPPPPAGVNVDEKPTSPASNCKVDRYASHASVGGCKSCHQSMDPIGFGLENYDRQGKYRLTDDGEPTCAIEGKGTLLLGSAPTDFVGADGLADAVRGSGAFEHCIVTQLLRFSAGRRELAEDAPLIDALTAGFKQKNRRFDGLLLDVVNDPGFTFRKEESL